MRQHRAIAENACAYGVLWTPTEPGNRPSTYPECLSRFYMPKETVHDLRDVLDDEIADDIWDFVFKDPRDEAAGEVLESILERMSPFTKTVARAAGIIGWMQTLYNIGGFLSKTVLAEQIDGKAVPYYVGSARFYENDIVISSYFSTVSSDELCGNRVAVWERDTVYGEPGYDDGSFVDNERDDWRELLP